VVALGVFHENDGRSWRRAAGIAAARYLLRIRTWTISELRSMLGATTAQAYAVWARKNCAEALTDELPEGAKLHWIGPRREDRVILYFHGAYPSSLLRCVDREGDGRRRVLRWRICSSGWSGPL
jgi:hypothetical protein